MKLRLLNDPAEKGQAWMAILGENTEETLRQLALEETRFSRYRPVYPLMDFLVKDFRKTLYPFDFQKLVPYFLISQFDGFEAFFSLTNEEHYHIAKGVLNGIVNNQTYPEHSLKAMVKEILSAMPGIVNFHDFRVVKGNTHTNIMFDVVASYSLKKTDAEIIEEIATAINNRDRKLFSVINVDRDYTGK